MNTNKDVLLQKKRKHKRMWWIGLCLIFFVLICGCTEAYFKIISEGYQTLFIVWLSIVFIIAILILRESFWQMHYIDQAITYGENFNYIGVWEFTLGGGMLVVPKYIEKENMTSCYLFHQKKDTPQVIKFAGRFQSTKELKGKISLWLGEYGLDLGVKEKS